MIRVFPINFPIDIQTKNFTDFVNSVRKMLIPTIHLERINLPLLPVHPEL